MRSRIPSLVPLALAPLVLVACRDSSTEVARRAELGLTAQTTSSDTGGGTQQFHFVSKGDFASISFGDSSGGNPAFGFLQVNRGGTVQNPEIFLFYDIERCDPFCHLVAGGAGPIPDGDLTGTAHTTLRLNTNTADNPDFIVFAGPAGRIVVEWVKTEQSHLRQNGTTEFTSGDGFRNHQTGQFTASSAEAVGDLVGLPIASQPAQIGTSNIVNIDIFR